jgi:hypothetical protein
MGEKRAEPDFREVQALRQRHARLVLAMPPAAMLFIAVRQLVFHHPWGNPAMSNGGVVFLTVLLVGVYIRLITVRLVTDVRSGELSVGLQGLWRKRKVPLAGIRSAIEVQYDPAADCGGYGIRSGAKGLAYIASGNRGVELELNDGRKLLIGSQRPEELARKIMQSGRCSPAPR